MVWRQRVASYLLRSASEVSWGLWGSPVRSREPWAPYITRGIVVIRRAFSHVRAQVPHLQLLVRLYTVLKSVISRVLTDPFVLSWVSVSSFVDLVDLTATISGFLIYIELGFAARTTASWAPGLDLRLRHWNNSTEKPQILNKSSRQNYPRQKRYRYNYTRIL